MQVTIERNGAILIGKNIVVDAHHNRPIRIITHIHSDHILGIQESLSNCDKILMTPITLELLKIIKGKLNEEKIYTMDYNEEFVPMYWDNEKIYFLPANHIVGSAQVVVESDTRIVYTSDFKLQGTPVISCDILIIEATYGNCQHTRKFKDEVKKRLIELISDKIEMGNVFIFGYYGKLQEILSLLYEENINIPVKMSDKIYNITKVCEKFGCKFTPYYKLKDTIPNTQYSILLYHMGASKWIKGGTKIYLSGWQFDEPIKKDRENEFTVAFSDHADFDELLQYIELSRPKFVITDNARVGDAVGLAEEIKKRFNISATPMPI